MLQEFITFYVEITTGWMAVHTFFMGIICFFWFTIVLGFLDIDLFGDIELDGVGEGSEGISGALSALMAFLNMDKVPVIITVSAVTIKMWLMGYYLHHYMPGTFNEGVIGNFIGPLIFAVTFVIASFLTAFTTKPLAPVFADYTTKGQEHLVGMECTIKSSKVTTTFGEAELKVDDSFIQISVRDSDNETFQKGDKAVIFDFDKEKNIYHIAAI